MKRVRIIKEVKSRLGTTFPKVSLFTEFSGDQVNRFPSIYVSMHPETSDKVRRAMYERTLRVQIEMFDRVSPAARLERAEEMVGEIIVAIEKDERFADAVSDLVKDYLLEESDLKEYSDGVAHAVLIYKFSYFEDFAGKLSR